VNVLKPHLQTTVLTLLAAGKSQREIERVTGVDRKTIRRLAQRPGGGKFPHPGHRDWCANSPTPATGESPLVL